MTAAQAAAWGATGDHSPLMDNYGSPPRLFVKGSGAELYDADGTRHSCAIVTDLFQRMVFPAFCVPLETFEQRIEESSGKLVVNDNLTQYSIH